jgi:hypothetical protein
MRFFVLFDRPAINWRDGSLHSFSGSLMNPMSLGFRDLWISVGEEGANLASPGENKDR